MSISSPDYINLFTKFKEGDGLYMSLRVPFLARMGKLTGDQKYFDEADR